MDRNYQHELEQLIEELQEKKIRPSLFLHSCCAPCSSYVLTYLTQYFDITLFYYNPNIMPEEEYRKRLSEQKRLLREAYPDGTVQFVEGQYEPQKFHEMAKGLEQEPEGGARCFKCYELRLKEAAQHAKDGGYDFFTTTLSISPHKNAAKLNEIGEAVAQEYKVAHLPSDFKKKDGYKKSIELSKKYNLYRQKWCGCGDFPK